MRSFIFWPAIAILLASCKERTPVEVSVAEGSVPMPVSASIAPPLSSSAPVVPSATPPAASASELPKPWYRRVDALCGNFDLPGFFTLERPGPENGKGAVWTWGTRARIACWWMYNVANETPASLCAESRNLVAHRVIGGACWETDRRGGKIRWAKTFAHTESDGGLGMINGLTIEYDEGLKEYFDPIVAHINASIKPFWP